MFSVDHVAHFLLSSPEPVITAMVSGGTSAVGESYSLVCTVTGADQLNPTITYRWFKDNTVVSGETQSTLSFSLSLYDSGQYRCDITVSSTLLNQSIIAVSNTQDLTLQCKYKYSLTICYLIVMLSHLVPPPTAVTVTASPGDIFIVDGHLLNLTCSIELSEVVDITMTVNTVWSGPSGTQFTTTTSVATRMTATTYISTATIRSVETSDSGEYTCTATVSSTSPFLTDSDEVFGVRNITVKGEGGVNIIVFDPLVIHCMHVHRHASNVSTQAGTNR